MFFRKKNRRPTDPDVTTVYYIVAFCMLIGMSSYMRENRDAPQRISAGFSKSLERIKSNSPIDFSARIFPDSESMLSIQDTRTGKGGPTVCGQTATVAYSVFLPDNTQAGPKATKESPLVVRIGEGKAMPALEQGLIGMQPGGVRNINAPPQLAFGLKKFANPAIPESAAVRLEVELLDVTPSLPDLAQTSYRFMDSRTGLGPVIECGMPVKVHITVWTSDGKKLYASRDEAPGPLAVTPGASDYFIGLEQAVIGMRAGGIRNVIVPPPFQKTMYDKPPALDIPFPKEQTALVDIESVP